jgi:hypothetical protein
MDYRKNFVKAMQLVGELDQLLADSDLTFQEFKELIVARSKKTIDEETFKQKLKTLGTKREKMLTQYEWISRRVQEIKDEFGGKIEM